jgi:hypothetical protein
VNCAESIKESQRLWSAGRGSLDGRGYFTRIEDNLFAPLDSETLSDLHGGQGGELKGKALAPWSSSALALNVFQYWRTRLGTAAVLSDALMIGTPSALRFESKHATGFGGPDAHLDVEILPWEGQGLPLGVESKMLEPFSGHKALRAAYTERDMSPTRRAQWSELPACRDLAQAMATGDVAFKRLDAPQLLKHTLGMTRSYGARRFELLLLWYAPPRAARASCAGELATLEEEIAHFGDKVRGDVNFRSMTYQELYQRLVKSSSGNRDYLEYLGGRYFQ